MSASESLISYVIPAYNAEADIVRAVESVLNQEHRQVEVLVVDDASGDNTATVVAALAVRDARVRLLRLPENRGVHAARCHGLQAAKGDFVGFVDSDDWVSPKHGALLLASLLQHNADIAVGNARLAEGPDRVGRHKIRLTRKGVVTGDLLEKFARLKFGSGVFWNKLYRTSVLRPYDALALDRRLESGEDYLVNLGAFSSARAVALVPEDVYFYFVRPNSITRSVSKARSLARHLRAYCVAVECYADRGEEFLRWVDFLHSRQCSLRSYWITDGQDLRAHDLEFAEVLSRLAVLRPSALYALIHSFDRESDAASGTLKARVRTWLNATQALARALLGRRR